MSELEQLGKKLGELQLEQRLDQIRLNTIDGIMQVREKQIEMLVANISMLNALETVTP